MQTHIGFTEFADSMHVYIGKRVQYNTIIKTSKFHRAINYKTESLFL